MTLQSAQALVVIGGFFHLGFALFHLAFWRLFDWPRDLRSLQPVNRAIVPVLNLCLTFVFLLAAYVAFCHSGELVATPLGRTWVAGLALFWLLRAAEQVVFFRLRHPASAAIFVVFLAGTALHLAPLWVSL
jgi:hypothetical protein